MTHLFSQLFLTLISHQVILTLIPRRYLNGLLNGKCLLIQVLPNKLGKSFFFSKNKQAYSPLIKFNNLTVCSCHVTYGFQSESTLYSCLNVKELLARSRREIWSLSDCNWTRTHNHLIRKGTLNHLAKLAKWLSVPLRIKWFWVPVQLQSITCLFKMLPHIKTLVWF